MDDKQWCKAWGKRSPADTDYTVAYSKNKNAGNAVATIKGIGVFHDAVQLQFTIEKAEQAALERMVPILQLEFQMETALIQPVQMPQQQVRHRKMQT